MVIDEISLMRDASRSRLTPAFRSYETNRECNGNYAAQIADWQRSQSENVNHFLWMLRALPIDTS